MNQPSSSTIPMNQSSIRGDGWADSILSTRQATPNYGFNLTLPSRSPSLSTLASRATSQESLPLFQSSRLLTKDHARPLFDSTMQLSKTASRLKYPPGATSTPVVPNYGYTGSNWSIGSALGSRNTSLTSLSRTSSLESLPLSAIQRGMNLTRKWTPVSRQWTPVGGPSVTGSTGTLQRLADSSAPIGGRWADILAQANRAPIRVGDRVLGPSQGTTAATLGAGPSNFTPQIQATFGPAQIGPHAAGGLSRSNSLSTISLGSSGGGNLSSLSSVGSGAGLLGGPSVAFKMPNAVSRMFRGIRRGFGNIRRRRYHRYDRFDMPEQFGAELGRPEHQLFVQAATSRMLKKAVAGVAGAAVIGGGIGYGVSDALQRSRRGPTLMDNVNLKMPEQHLTTNYLKPPKKHLAINTGPPSKKKKVTFSDYIDFAGRPSRYATTTTNRW